MHPNMEDNAMNKTIPLSELKPGEIAVIVKVKGDREIRRRILDMGVVTGVEIKVVRKAPLGDPVELFVKNYHLTLRKKEASQIYVNKIGGEKNEG